MSESPPKRLPPTPHRHGQRSDPAARGRLPASPGDWRVRMGDEAGRDPKEERGALWLTLGHPCSIWGRVEKEGVSCYFSDPLPRLSKPWELGRWSRLGGLEEEA